MVVDRDVVFRATMRAGHFIKISSEIAKNFIPGTVWLDMKTDGTVEIKGNDSKNTVSISLVLKNFSDYVCKKRQTVHMDIQHFYRMIKNCKKKVPITLMIETSESEQINIIVGDVQTYLLIERPQLVFSKDPTGYEEHPCVIDSKDFQVMCKEMQLTNGKTIQISQLPDGKLEFSIKTSLYGKTVPLGSRIVGKKPVKYKSVSMNFTFKVLTRLVKVPNVSRIIKVYFTEGKPLKICFDIDSFGEGCVYIRSLTDQPSDLISIHESLADDEEDFNNL